MPEKMSRPSGYSSLHLACPKESKPEDKFQVASENQILLYVHELFHVFQGSFYTFAHGNLQYNPDTNYAVYSEIEGEALKQAFLAKEYSVAKEYLKDFIAARKLKYREHGPPRAGPGNGGRLHGGNRPGIPSMRSSSKSPRSTSRKSARQDDPYFFGFKDLKSFLRSEAPGAGRFQGHDPGKPLKMLSIRLFSSAPAQPLFSGLAKIDPRKISLSFGHHLRFSGHEKERRTKSRRETLCKV